MVPFEILLRIVLACALFVYSFIFGELTAVNYRVPSRHAVPERVRAAIPPHRGVPVRPDPRLPGSLAPPPTGSEGQGLYEQAYPKSNSQTLIFTKFDVTTISQEKSLPTDDEVREEVDAADVGGAVAGAAGWRLPARAPRQRRRAESHDRIEPESARLHWEENNITTRLSDDSAAAFYCRKCNNLIPPSESQYSIAS
ncbi:uncharacterized protein [Choristoneura fumiferana]|uniref:uncharacterized protein n=1 Tax=Choristoneura fumiferana TaxID=7141 RepID=UPI003D1570A9